MYFNAAAPSGYQSFLAAFGAGAPAFFMLNDGTGLTLGGVWTVNPAAALKAEGIDVPAGMAVTVLESTDKQFYLVLPPTPTDALSDEAPDGVAGGFKG